MLYLIWRDPWMTVGADTYAHDLLDLCGGANVFADRAECWVPTQNAEASLAALSEESGIALANLSGVLSAWLGVLLATYQGGVSADLPDGWREETLEVCDLVEGGVPAYLAAQAKPGWIIGYDSRLHSPDALDRLQHNRQHRACKGSAGQASTDKNRQHQNATPNGGTRDKAEAERENRDPEARERSGDRHIRPQLLHSGRLQCIA